MNRWAACSRRGQACTNWTKRSCWAARPDLIIAQDLCDVCAITSSQLDHVVRSLSPSPRMVTLTPRRLEDILRDIETLGAALGQEGAGRQLSAKLRARINVVHAKVASEHIRPTVACLEWLAPLYTAGHWVPDMVEAAGGIDVSTAGTPSQKVNWDTLSAASPDVIILMPCGFTVERTRTELAALTEQPQWKKSFRCSDRSGVSRRCPAYVAAPVHA